MGGPRDRNMTGGNMRIWGLKNCDTCRKAVKALDAAGRAPDYVDVRADGVAAANLERFFAPSARRWSTNARPRGVGCRKTNGPGIRLPCWLSTQR